MIIPKEYQLSFLEENEHTVELYINLYQSVLDSGIYIELEERKILLHNLIIYQTIKIIEDHCE